MQSVKLSLILCYLTFTINTCDNPTESQPIFNIQIKSPVNDSVITDTPIQIIIEIDKPNAVDNLDIYINNILWMEPEPISNFQLDFLPPSGLQNENYIIKAIGKNPGHTAFDSIHFYISSPDSLLHSNIPFKTCCNGEPEFQFMIHHVTNQIYRDYLIERLISGTLIVTENGKIKNVGEENIHYDSSKGRIYFDESNNPIITINYDNHPVVGITWFGANEFAAYFGWKLPTLEQWQELALQTIELNPDSLYKYPWGDIITPDDANFGSNYNSTQTTPVGWFNGTNLGATGGCTHDSESLQGAYDIVGNVWQFTASPHELAPENMMVCGGSFASLSPALQASKEACSVLPINISTENHGFRCIADINFSTPNYLWTPQDGGGTEDDCGICNGENSDMDDCGICANACPPENNENPVTNNDLSCEGLYGGNGNINNSCTDCNGELNGEAKEDECGFCDTDPENDCLPDCAGVPNGNSYIDKCDNCVEPFDISCDIDCNGKNGGDAKMDNCGVCDSDDSNNDSDMDCNGECVGAAVENECGCVGGTTGLALDWCYGCTDWEADNFHCNKIEGINCCPPLSNPGNDPNEDGWCYYSGINTTAGDCLINSKNYKEINECYYDPDNTSAFHVVFFPDLLQDDGSCEYWGCTNSNYSNYEPSATNCGNADESCCEIWGCTDSEADNYSQDATNCQNGGDSCCEYWGCTNPGGGNYDQSFTNCENNDDSCCTAKAFFSLKNLNTTDNTIDIYLDTLLSDVSGFEIQLSGVIIEGISGGLSEQYDFALESVTNTILGFSLNFTTIPSGESGLLTQVTFSNYVGGDICFSGLDDVNNDGNPDPKCIIADPDAKELISQWGECLHE